MRNVKIANAIICEDVRVEGNGKHIILGVFANDILVSEVPAFVPFMVWLQIDDVEAGGIKFDFRAAFSGHEFAKGGITVTNKEHGVATVMLGQLPLEVKEDGQLTVDLRYALGGRWKNVATKRVIVRGPSGS